MNRLTAVCSLSLAMLLANTTAKAQFAAPVQPPRVEPAGTFIVYPSVGVLDDSDFTDAALMLRGRYSVLDQVSLSGELGGAFGDTDEFEIGFGSKLQLLEQSVDLPIEVSIFGGFDAGIGDVDSETLAFGPLVGHRFDVDQLGVTPYGGFAVGFTHVSNEDGRRDDGGDGSDTNVLFGLIFGSDIAFTPQLSTTVEFEFGTTDGIPALNWHWALAYELFPAPRYVPPVSSPS